MSLAGAKSLAHQAQDVKINDTERLRLLTEAVNQLVKVVGDLESDIQDLVIKQRHK